MLLYEYKLRLSRAQAAAIDEAIRTTQFIRNKAVRLWMDGRGVSANDLQLLCARLAQEYPLRRGAQLASPPAPPPAPGPPSRVFTPTAEKSVPARRAIRASNAIVARWSTSRRAGSSTPRGSASPSPMAVALGGCGSLARVNWRRSPVSKSSGCGWCGGRTGTMPSSCCRWSGASSMSLRARRVGIDVGIAAYLTDSEGHAVANPRFIRLAEARLKRSQRRLSRRSVSHKQGKKPRTNHAARQRARHKKYPKDPAAPAAPSPRPPPIPAYPCASTPSPQRQSANWGKAKQRVGRAYLHLQRQREDFARKTASALISSHDLIALEDLHVRNLVRNRRFGQSDLGCELVASAALGGVLRQAARGPGGGGSTGIHQPGL